MKQMAFSRLQHLWEVGLILAVGICLTAGAPAAEQQTRSTTQPARTCILRFPKSSRWIGSLFAYSPDSPPRDVVNTPTDGEFLGRIRGDIVVPEGKLLLLLVWEQGGRNPSCLSRLAPDDLYAVWFDKPWGSKINPGDAILPHITRLTGLRYLGIANTNVTAKGIKQLAKLPHLERLALPYTVTNQGLAEAIRLPSLKALGLRSGQITDQDVALLAGMPRLEELDLAANEITDASLAHLTSLPRLRSIHLWGPKITNAGMAHLARIRSLRTVSIRHLNVTDAGLAELAKLPDLESMDVVNTLVTDEGLAHLKLLRSLKVLDFCSKVGDSTENRVRLTDRGLAHLEPITSLEVLILRGEFTDEGIAHLRGLPRLARLAIAGHFSDTGLEHLSKLQSLRSLAFKTDQLAEAGMARLAELESLRTLGISTKGVPDAGLAHLFRLRNLEELNINAPLTDQGLAHLGRLTSLTQLVIGTHKAPVSVSGLSRLNTLSNLVLLKVYSEVRQDGSGLDLSGLTMLEHLTVDTIGKETRFTDQDLASLAKLKRLRDLTLNGDFTDEGMAHLGHLPELTIFTTSWREARITDRGLAELSKCRKLWYLHISGDFTDKGLAALGDMPELTLVSIQSKRPFSDQAVARFKAKRPEGRLTQRPQPPGSRTAEKTSGKAPAK